MNAYESTLEKLHLSFKPGSPDDPPYPEPEFFLKGIPLGFCPWCFDKRSFWNTGRVWNTVDGGSSHELPVMEDVPSIWCPDWDHDDTETENRIRYAAERLEDAQVRQP